MVSGIMSGPASPECTSADDNRVRRCDEAVLHDGVAHLPQGDLRGECLPMEYHGFQVAVIDPL